MATIDGKLKEILTKYHPNPREAIWDCHGKWVAYHAALEEIGRNAKISFQPPLVLEANGDTKCVAICVTGSMEGAGTAEWSIGEASPHNYRTTGKQAAYPFAMAEKRAKDRVILKLIGLHGAVYSEEEADDFKGGGTAPSVGTGDTLLDAPADETLTVEQREGARSAYRRIADALNSARTVKVIDDILLVQKKDLALIKRAHPPSHAALTALADRRRQTIASAP